MSDRFTKPGRRWLRPAFAITAVVTGLACGNLTAGGFGKVVVTVSGDVPSTSSATRAPTWGTPGPFPAPATLASGEDEPEGEIEAEFELFLVTPDGTAARLTDEAIRVRVDLRGRNEIDVVEKLVEATAYAELRMVFTDIKARVDSGLVINGVPIVGEVRVELDNVEIEVSRSIDLDLEAFARAELLVDLNAGSWLQSVDPIARTVDAAVFASLISIAMR